MSTADVQPGDFAVDRSRSAADDANSNWKASMQEVADSLQIIVDDESVDEDVRSMIEISISCIRSAIQEVDSVCRLTGNASAFSVMALKAADSSSSFSAEMALGQSDRKDELAQKARNDLENLLKRVMRYLTKLMSDEATYTDDQRIIGMNVENIARAKDQLEQVLQTAHTASMNLAGQMFSQQGMNWRSKSSRRASLAC